MIFSFRIVVFVTWITFLLSCSHLNAQTNVLKLSAEVLSASNELENALSDLQDMQVAINDIKNNKAPSIPDNGWSDLANKYKDAASVIRNASLPTEFDSKKYSVSFDEMRNCKLKDQNLRRLNDYSLQIKDAKIRGEESIIMLKEMERKIKITREILRYCIETHEKLISTPIFGQKFLLNWFVLDQDVSKAMSEFQDAVMSQRKKIVSEKEKLVLYLSNFESNVLRVKNFLSQHCKDQKETEESKESRSNEKPLDEHSQAASLTVRDENKLGDAFYVFLTTTLQSSKTLYAISKPMLHGGGLKDDLQNEKQQFIADMQKQFANDPKLLNVIASAEIIVHYGKPYSTQILKTNAAVNDAIEAYKQSLRDAIDGLGADPIEFLQINHD